MAAAGGDDDMVTHASTQVADETALPRRVALSQQLAQAHPSKSDLEKQLLTSFELDHKRKAEDAMKKRAILTARSYDEFRNLVAASTLKPLDKEDKSTKAYVAANKSVASGGGASGGYRGGTIGFGLEAHLPLPSSAGAAALTAAEGEGSATGSAADAAARAAATVSSTSSSSSSPSLGLPLPTTAPEFERTWRRLAAGKSGEALQQSRYSLLRSLGPKGLSTCFRRELDADLLGQLLLVLAAQTSLKPAASTGAAAACGGSAAAAGGGTGSVDLPSAGDGSAAAALAVEAATFAAAVLRAPPPAIVGMTVQLLGPAERRAGEKLVTGARAAGAGSTASALEEALEE